MIIKAKCVFGIFKLPLKSSQNQEKVELKTAWDNAKRSEKLCEGSVHVWIAQVFMSHLTNVF